MSDVRFDEVMTGFVSFAHTDYNQALADGRRAGRTIVLRLHLEVPDADALAADPATPARVSGTVDVPELGPPLEVVDGTLALFADHPDHRHRRMLYRLRCRAGTGAPVTVAGMKVIEDDPGLDLRTDVSTLFVRVLRGWPEQEEDRVADVICTGVARLGPVRFARMAASMRRRRGRFAETFAREAVVAHLGPDLADARPDFPPSSPGFAGHPPGAWHAVPGRDDLERRIVAYTARDERPLVLQQLRHRDAPAPHRGPVVLVHGAGGRPNFFYEAPMRTTFADALLQRGYDVWCQAWRGTIDDPPNRWTLDQVAAHDHPAAIETVVRETGASSVRVVAQCQGATTYAIAVVAGLVPQVSHVLFGAVSLHPVVALRGRLKSAALLPGLLATTPWLDAQWGIRAPHAYAAGIARMARLVRGRDCDDPVCHCANFMFGSGPELLWQHAQLSEEVHAFLGREFGACPISFYRQMQRSVRRGILVPAPGAPGGLPADYGGAPRSDAVMTFACGENNRVFLPEGQRRSFAHMDRYAPGRHRHLSWPRYGHLDPWLGRAAEREVFPSAIAALER